MNSYTDNRGAMGPGAPLPGMWGWMLDTASLYGEVLLRSRFGATHLTLFGVLLGLAGLLFLPLVAVMVFTFLLSSYLLGSIGGLFAAAFSTQLPWAKGTIYFHIFTLAFLARSCWHFIEMEYRQRAGEQVVSTYSGRPSVLWRLIPGLCCHEGAIKRFGEPAVLFLFALWVRHTDLLLTLYLATSATAMFVKGHFENMFILKRVRASQDQMLEAQALGGQMTGRSNQPGDVRGVAVPAVLGSYPDYQARAIASTLQSQAPLYPLSNNARYLPPGNFSSGLAPEYSRMLSQSNPIEKPIDDWFFEELKVPLIDDWFEPTSAPEESAESRLKPLPGSQLKLIYQCRVCGAKYRTGPEHVGKRSTCKKCGDVFRVPKPT